VQGVCMTECLTQEAVTLHWQNMAGILLLVLPIVAFLWFVVMHFTTLRFTKLGRAKAFRKHELQRTASQYVRMGLDEKDALERARHELHVNACEILT
jgi:flagellar biogenesis protein FliO